MNPSSTRKQDVVAKSGKYFLSGLFALLLLSFLPPVFAADGDLHADGVTLYDTNANGKIDRIDLAVEFAGTATALEHATDEATTLAKFTVTDDTSTNPVTVSAIELVQPAVAGKAVVRLTLDEADADLSVDTSATALNVVYDDTSSDLKITNGVDPAVSVAAIATGVVEKDGAAPVFLSAAYVDANQDARIDQLEFHFSEPLTLTQYEDADWQVTTPGSIGLQNETDVAVYGVDPKILIVTANGVENITGGAVSPTVTYTAANGTADSLVDAQGLAAGDLTIDTFADLAAPVIVSVKGTSGASTANVTFSEPVYTNVDTTGDLTTADLVYTDTSAGNATSITGITHTAGNATAVLTLDAALNVADTADTLAPALNAIYDAVGIVADSALTKTLSVDPACTDNGNACNIQLWDNNGNGKIDHITFAVGNPAADTWEANGVLPHGVSVTKGGADITVSSVTLTSAANALSVTFDIALDETDTDLTSGTDTSAIELIYTPTAGDAACVNCIKSGTKQLTAIATGDTGDFDTEKDKAAPVLTQVSAPTAGNKPSYVFSSTEPGAITYGGNCGNGDLTNAVSGDNTAVFGGVDGLAAGTYNCTITVTDPETNASVPLAVPQIIVQTTSGGGGGGGGGGSRRTSGSTGTFSMPTTQSDTEVKSTRPVSLDKVKGVLPRPLLISHATTKHSVLIPKDTTITDSNDKPFTGVLIVPTSLKNSELPAIPPEYKVVASIKAGASDNQPLKLSKNAVLTIPIPTDIPDAAKLNVYFYNTASGKLELIDSTFGATGSQITAETDHLSSFLVLDTGGNEVASIPVTSDNTGTGSGSGDDDENEGGLSGEEETPVPSIPPPFSDIVGHWAQAFITELFNRGVVNGKSPGIYDPNADLTRAELTKMATLAFGVAVPPSVSAAPFNDVETTAWYAPFIQVAKERGIVTGFPENLFKPNKEVTRAEALKIILETSGATVVAGINPFFDVKADGWYVSYVTFAAEKNIVSGYGDGSFGPNNPITRAEIAKIIIQAMAAQGQ